jgi:hypothetical protein
MAIKLQLRWGHCEEFHVAFLTKYRTSWRKNENDRTKHEKNKSPHLLQQMKILKHTCSLLINKCF